LTIDPYLFGISATLRPDSDPDRVESVILDQLTRLAAEPVPADELGRAVKQIRAQMAYSQQSVSSKAYLLGALAMVAPERTPESLLDAVVAVSAEDVQRAAATYLLSDRRTVGWLIPTDEAPAATRPNASAMPRPAGYVPDTDDVTLDPTMPGVRETRLRDGLRVLTLDQAQPETGGPVVVRLRIPGGSSVEGKTAGVARFASEMLTRGSAGRTIDDLAEELDGLGASITAGAGRESIDLVATSLREDVDRVTELMAAALLQPDFPDDQVEIVRGQILTGLRQAQQDTRAEAEQMLRRMLYPHNHPYRERVSGTEESVQAIARGDLQAYQAAALRPSDAIVAVAGGLAHEDAVALVERHLGQWTGETPAVVVPDPVLSAASQRESGSIPGKAQADIAIGTLAVARSNPEYYALNVANLILGRFGLMGRLGESVRERQGMAYYAFSGLEVGLGVGFWSARAGVNPANVERVIETILAEVRLYLEQGPTESEFHDAIGHIDGSLPMALETVGSISAVLADIAFFDLGLDYLRRYRGIIRVLTREQLVAAMRRYVDPERLAIAVVGPTDG
jgi:zinc protease